MTSRPTGHALALPGFVLLALLAATPVQAQRSAPVTGSIHGTIRCAEGRSAGVQARVVVIGARLGAQADEQGRYTIRGVPAGIQTLQVTQQGAQQRTITITVPANRDTTVDIELCSYPPEAPEIWRFSVNPKLHSVIKSAISVHTQRLLDEVTRKHEKPTLQRLGDPLGEARPCDLAWRDTLLAAVERTGFSPKGQATAPACTGYAEVRVIFRSETERVTMRVCYLCGQVGLILEGAKAHRIAEAGSFGENAPSFVRFVRAHYSADAILMGIVDRAYSVRER